MRKIDANTVTTAVAKLCIDANYYIGDDILDALTTAKAKEQESLSKTVLDMLVQNADIARTDRVPICQDTGMAVVFVDIGQDVHIIGCLEKAINNGVKAGYDAGYLRKSVVGDPIQRKNTNDNTPAIIHYNITDGSALKITVAPKGAGSENMSAIKMLNPSDGIEGVKAFVVETVKNAGSNPCPPIIVGVGVGGTFEKAAIMSKQALLRDVGTINKADYWNAVEQELLAAINTLNIGPSGFGGGSTALAVHINTFATHIACLPVAVNIGCHVTRHKSIVL